MKKINAKSIIEIYCRCPYCNAYNDVTGEVGATDYSGGEIINIEYSCSECHKFFIIQKVEN